MKNNTTNIKEKLDEILEKWFDDAFRHGLMNCPVKEITNEIFALLEEQKKSYALESWQPVKDYETLYEVSNWGKVKSVNGTLLKQYNCNGYMRSSLCKNGKCKQYFVHRLVGQVFISNPKNLPYINHLDCNRSNNHVENIEWCTHKENIQYAVSLDRVGHWKNGKIYHAEPKVKAERTEKNGWRYEVPREHFVKMGKLSIESKRKKAFIYEGKIMKYKSKLQRSKIK